MLPEEIKAGLAHLGSAALESLLCSCTSDSKCSVCLSLRIPDEILQKEQQPNICALAVSSNEPVADWWCARKRPASTQTNAWYTHVYVWCDGAFQGPIAGVCVLSRWHLSERCNCGGKRGKKSSVSGAPSISLTEIMKRKLNKPAVHVFRLSRCGSKMKLERQQSMERLSPNFQDADVIVLAVALFKLAAVPWTKASLPHVFLCKPRFSFVEVGCSWLKLFSTVWDDTEHLLLMYRPQIQCKDLSCSHGHRVKDAEKADLDSNGSRPTSFLFILLCLLLAAFLFFKHVKKVGAMIIPREVLTLRRRSYSWAAE